MAMSKGKTEVKVVVTSHCNTPERHSKVDARVRAGLPGIPLPKKSRRDDNSHKAESINACADPPPSKGSLQDMATRKKDNEARRKDSISRALSSSSLNVQSPMMSPRVSLNRHSGGELKSLTPARSTINRTPGSSKRSAGPYTPTPKNVRRSSTNLRRSASRLSDQLRLSSGGGGAVSVSTPEVVVSLHSSDVQGISPGMESDSRTESTAVSVGVRVRPLFTREESSAEVQNVVEVLGKNLQITTEAGTIHTFNYDHCFWSCDPLDPFYTAQDGVYNALGRPLLEKAYEGYNVCLFAYGQTGSGKSYTMLGDSHEGPELELHADAGIIPRFCRDLFARADYLHSQNTPSSQTPQCQVEVEVSYIEIYNERIYDLLSGSTRGERREALRVREHPEHGPYVEGATHHAVSSYSQIQTSLLLGNKERSIAATGMNEKSSRSHAVFTIRLSLMQVEDVEGDSLESTKVSTINLVDLAGSERVAAAHSQGDRLKEGVHINKSLFTLGKVITGLAESSGRRRPFIPYRESVLTYLLKESLGGNSRTAMIATISPCSTHVEETLSTLRYAQQARKIVNHNHVNEDPAAAIIRSLKEEVERLRRQQVVRSPSSLLFDADIADDDLSSDKVDDNERALLEKEKAIVEKEEEKKRAIKEKEEEIALLREQLKYQQQCNNEKTRSLEQRLKVTEIQQQEALENLRLQGIASEGEKGPVLINLHDDPQLSETLSYRLKEGTTSIGQSLCDLTLQALHTNDTHCVIHNENGHLMLLPKPDRDTCVNGRLATFPVQLHHNDRLVLAGIYYFRINNSSGEEDATPDASEKYDFYFTNQELLKEQERRLRLEAETAMAASRAELEREMCHQRDQLMEVIEDAQTQLVAKEQQVSELEGAQWKLEVEKRLLEEQIERDRKTSEVVNSSFQAPAAPQSNFVQQVEDIFNESVIEIRKEPTSFASPLLSFRIKEANQLCEKLGKPFEFMAQEILNERGVETNVLVKDTRHHLTASLTTSAFMVKLQALRDIAQGEECDDEVFEQSMKWQRSEEMSCIPGFQNKLRECPALQGFYASLNCSLNASLSTLAHSFNGGRGKSIIRSPLERGSIVPNSDPVAGSSVTVATAIHTVLCGLPTNSHFKPPLNTVVTALADLHSISQKIRDHITEPGMSLSEEELSKVLIQLLLNEQTATTALSAANSTDVTTGCHRCLKLQAEMRTVPTKIRSCTCRIFEGFSIDVESLVEEESSKLILLIRNLFADISKFALTASLPLPDISDLPPDGTLCKKFTEGLCRGMIWLILGAGEASSSATKCLAFSLPSYSNRRLEGSPCPLETTHKAMKAITLFLEKFRHLDVAYEQVENITLEKQRHKMNQWIARVESASDTIVQLTTSINAVVKHFEKPYEDAVSTEFEGTVRDLKVRLQELMRFAGLNSTQAEESNELSFSSNSDLENSTVFMENFHSLAWRSVEAVQVLESVVQNSLPSSKSPKQTFRSQTLKPFQSNDNSKISACSNLMQSHWPKNSNEYREYLRHQKENIKLKSPMKSSLRSTSCKTRWEEKKVRFNVNLTSLESDEESSIDV